jgi:molybdopterin/thiamine biosynthesis adenylyltransferase
VVIDGDRLEASNLHRQTWFALADCGRPKVDLAAARIRALNPEVQIEAHGLRLDAGNAARLLAGCDLIIDCSDNFATKFLLNDLAHELSVPVLLASVHQFEGQLQVVDPARGSACLRCLWPQATRDGVVGNCTEAGVLGPVPGILGSLQALEALKILLDLPGRLGDEVLLVNLLETGMTRGRSLWARGDGLARHPTSLGEDFVRQRRRTRTRLRRSRAGHLGRLFGDRHPSPGRMRSRSAARVRAPHPHGRDAGRTEPTG